MKLRKVLLHWSLPAVLLLAGHSVLKAQSAGEREQLQARIGKLEQQLARASGKEAEQLSGKLARLRLRLTEGDFQPGDAIVLRVSGEAVLSDTFTVSQQREVRLPGLAPISLRGVLRDEIEPFLTEELRRYLRDPEVTAYPLMRLGVLGAVKQPGFYFLRPDAQVLDVFSSAGGLTNNAKVNAVELRRYGQPVVQSTTLRQAMAAGWNLQQLDVRAGDEVYVPEKAPPISTRDWVFIVSGLVGVTFTVLTATGAL